MGRLETEERRFNSIQEKEKRESGASRWIHHVSEDEVEGGREKSEEGEREQTMEEGRDKRREEEREEKRRLKEHTCCTSSLVKGLLIAEACVAVLSCLGSCSD